MKCNNCGAEQVYQPEQGRLFCPYCKSWEVTPESLLGIYLLEEQPGQSCPFCHVPLNRAKLSEQAGFYCRHCGGLLLQNEVFELIVEWRRAGAGGEGIIPSMERKDEVRPPLCCPQCGRIMDKHAYGGPGNILVDTCAVCQLIWLDGGELERVVNAPGRDRGQSAFD